MYKMKVNVFSGKITDKNIYSKTLMIDTRF